MAIDQGGDGEGGGYLARFSKLRRRDGDFEGVVRGIYEDGGEEIGGSMDEHYYDEENEEEEVNDSAKVNGDVEMDDASVLQKQIIPSWFVRRACVHQQRNKQATGVIIEACGITAS